MMKNFDNERIRCTYFFDPRELLLRLRNPPKKMQKKRNECDVVCWQ